MAKDSDERARARAIAAMFSVELLDTSPPEDDDAKRTRLLPRGGTSALGRAMLGSPDDTADETPREEHPPVRRADPLVGQVLGGLRVVGLIGSGAMADVYAARALASEREVAVKVLRDEWAASPEARARLARELAVLEVIDHPNIVRVLGSGETPDGRPYIVMERVAGPSLRTVLARGAVTPERARVIALDVAEGLAVAHEAGVLHRDLQPGNVMLTRSGLGPSATERAKLVDFGCARATGALADERHLTQAFGFLGTPAFAAPEQLSSPASIDTRADLYALGGLIYAMITGQPPFSGTAVEVLAKKQQLTRPARPPEAGGLGALALALLTPRAEDRPSSAREVIRQLEQLDGAASRTELLEVDAIADVLDTPTTTAPSAQHAPLGHAGQRASTAEVDTAPTKVATLPERGDAARDTTTHAGRWVLAALVVAALAAAALLAR